MPVPDLVVGLPSRLGTVVGSDRHVGDVDGIDVLSWHVAVIWDIKVSNFVWIHELETRPQLG